MLGFCVTQGLAHRLVDAYQVIVSEDNGAYLDMDEYKGDKILQLNYKGLTSLPLQLTNTKDFHHITKLYLKSNLLQTLPEEISQLQNLMVLYVPGNKLSTLPESICELSRLESLDVSVNNLHRLPDAIGQLTQLKKLKFSHNKVTHLPKSVGRLQCLESVEALHNHMHQLPLQLFDCHQLNSLSLDSNSLKLIPRQICRLVNLQEVSVTANKLIMLPQGLGESGVLRTVFVDSNSYLSALPLQFHTIQVGSYRCGTECLPEELLCYPEMLCCVQVGEDKTPVPLPPEIQHVGDVRGSRVLTLTEIALRSTVLHSTSDDLSWIPKIFEDLLRTPTALCFNCKNPVFTMAFPVVYKSNMSCPYLLGLCCSSSCVSNADSLLNLPLVYPT